MKNKDEITYLYSFEVEAEKLIQYMNVKKTN